MLPSSNNDRSLFDSVFKRPSNSNFLYDPNPNYTTQDDLLHDPPLFFSNFSSPFFDEHELPLNHQILSQPTSENCCAAIPSLDRITTTEQSKSMEIVEFTSDLKKDRGSNSNPKPKGTNVRKKSVLGIVPRRRAGKKDRHSKICTAQGIRDRRMRLSLQAARKFFDLQDLLGYDKASKTIEWLFDKSKNAIAELAKDHPQAPIHMSISTDVNSESLISECEVVSRIKPNSKNDARDMVVTSIRSNLDSNNFAIEEERKQSLEDVVTSKPNQTRESRERARARARCRTLQKMMIKSIDEYSDHQGLRSNPCEGLQLSNPNDCYLEPKLGSCSNILFEGADHYNETSNLIQERGFTQYGVVFENEQLNDVGTLENLIGNKSSSSSSSSCTNSDVFYSSVSAVSGYSDPNTNLMEYMGIWEVFNNEKVNNFQYHFMSTQASTAENPNSNHSVKIPDSL